MPVEILAATPDDHDELFAAFDRVVSAGDGFPQGPPLSRADFDDYWIAHSTVVCIARFDGHLVGGYYIKPNFVGRAAHIANAGYFVLSAYRGNGVGRSMVEHSLAEARQAGFDAMQFNLVFASNPARSMYRKLGFQEIGRIPEAVDGEDAVIYWRSLDLPGPMSDVTIDTIADHVASVCLRRPPNNFFDTELLRQLATAYEELGSGNWCRAIVLSAEGKNFCAGLDFAANAGQDIADLYANAVRLFAAPLPVVAAVGGAAVGGGFGLALSADFRVATPSSRFSANFSRLGFHHGFAMTVTLPAVVGSQAAADLLYTGRRVGGDEALALGLCDELVNEPELLRRAAALAGSIAGSGPLAVRAIRATLRQGLVERVRLAMDHECEEQERLRVTSDFAEGVRASAARREPRFTGT